MASGQLLMFRLLNILIYFYLFPGLHCIGQASWLPCQFIEHKLFVDSQNITETLILTREAAVQFGKAGDTAVNPNTITFLISGLKVDLKQYLDQVDPDKLECELRRYKPVGSEVRWPGHGAHTLDCWFHCIFRHTEGLLTVSSFLRQGQEDCHRSSAIGDRDVVTTSVAMVLQTHSPSVVARLRSDQKLHCEFAVDHKKPHVSVDWHLREYGHRTRLFSHDSRSGETFRSGVGLRSLAKGDASYSLPFVQIAHEGPYVCSVSVPPLSTSVDIKLHIQESPLISLNVDSALTMQEASEQKVECEAKGYYPLDVDIVWYRQEPGSTGQRVGTSLPERIPNIFLSSHRNNQGGTYSISAFFDLKSSLKHSGSRYTCKVYHVSLRVPIQKSFVLTVHEATNWMFYAVMTVLAVIILLGVLYLYSAPRTPEKKPY